jgi:hypothetical protein
MPALHDYLMAETNCSKVRFADRIRLRKVPRATSLWLGTASVAISPFGHNDMTASLSCHTPTKFFEYFYCFLPA